MRSFIVSIGADANEAGTARPDRLSISTSMLSGPGRRCLDVAVAVIDAREPPRSRKGAQTRARLLEAAKKVFERDGFLNARILDIAETAGLKHGSFYHYFDSKEQIFREVAEAQEERLTAPPDSDRRPRTRDTSPWATIRDANRR